MHGQNENPMLPAALSYAADNITSFSLHGVADGRCTCGSLKCTSPGKHPATKRGFKDATTDEKQLRQWFSHRQFNIGCPAGKRNGFWVVDIDYRKGGRESLAKLEAQHGPLPDTARQITGNGEHLLFDYPDDGLDVFNGTELLPGIDVRGEGGYIVMAPSMHVSGRRYEAQRCGGILSAPQWLLDFVRSKAGKRTASLPRNTQSIAAAPPAGRSRIADTLQNVEPPPRDTLYEREKLWSLLNHVGSDELRTFDPDCSYDDWCKTLMGVNATEWGCAAEIADAWSKQAPHRYPSGGIEDIRAKMASFKRERSPDAITERSLYKIGIDSGWTPPPPSREAKLEIAARATRDVIAAATQDGAVGTHPRAYFETDLGNAKQLVARHGANIRFIPEWKSWIIWDGARWRVDNDGGIMRFAKETVETMLREAVNIGDSDKRDRQAKHALRCQAAARLIAMVALATTESEVVLPAARLDADPWLLGVQNGVVELRTGKFRAATREDFITLQAGVAFDPEVTCPNWETFINTVTGGDRDLTAYYQRAAGYVATGLTHEEVIFIPWGTGNNGKSVYRETMHDLMGDYAITADASLLLERRNTGGATPELARLKGRRLVAINETSEGDKLNESRVKFITGHDRIAARNLYEGYFEFVPTHKLVLTTNHKPIIRGTDVGIWRRIHLWSFTITIPPNQVEKDFRERRLKPELPGILNWLLEGLRMYRQEGLSPPAAVQGATNTYQHDMDVVGQWLDERCIIDPQTSVPSGAAYADYERWAQGEIGWTHTQLKFRRNLTDRGFSLGKGTGGQRLIRGLRLIYGLMAGGSAPLTVVPSRRG